MGFRDPWLLNAFHAELLACVHGLTVSANWGMSRVVLETDSQLVQSALAKNSFILAETGGISPWGRHPWAMVHPVQGVCRII